MTQSCMRNQGFTAIFCLALLLAYSLIFNSPVKSIFPYVIPVVIIATRCGWSSGLVLSFISTSVAWIGQAFPTVPQNAGLEFDEALITFSELVIASVIASAVSRKISGISKNKLFD